MRILRDDHNDPGSSSTITAFQKPMTAAILATIQAEAFTWQKRNFGETDAQTMLIGCAEEPIP